MQFEISTAEAAELFSVTKKTIALWSQQGIMAKLRHGTYDLKRSLQNWTEYQRCIHEGAADPMLLWQIRRDQRESEANPQPNFDLENMILVPIEDLGLRTYEVELDDAGNIKRVIGEISDDQSRG
jgi:hypothetical protein